MSKLDLKTIWAATNDVLHSEDKTTIVFLSREEGEKRCSGSSSSTRISSLSLAVSSSLHPHPKRFFSLTHTHFSLLKRKTIVNRTRLWTWKRKCGVLRRRCCCRWCCCCCLRRRRRRRPAGRTRRRTPGRTRVRTRSTVARTARPATSCPRAGGEGMP